MTIDLPVKPPSKLSHVVLRTANLENMSLFYQNFLGAKVVYEDEDASFVTYDNEHHRIGILRHPGLQAKNPKTSGLDVRYKLDSIEL